MMGVSYCIAIGKGTSATESHSFAIGDGCNAAVLHSDGTWTINWPEIERIAAMDMAKAISDVTGGRDDFYYLPQIIVMVRLILGAKGTFAERT